MNVLPAALAAAIAFASSASAVVSYGTAGAVYTERFDSLAAPASATTTAFVNDGTIDGLFAFHSNATSGATGILRNQPDSPAFVAVDNYLAPSAITGSRVYSFGAAGAADRAFGGSTGSTLRNATNNTTPGDYYYALVLRNTTGTALDSFSLSYAGEQWVEAANPTTLTQSLRFDYLITAAFSANDVATSSDFGTYVPVPALDFAVPQNANTGASALVRDGNADAYRDVMSATVPVAWADGDYLVLRYFDDDSAGNDHGIAIDDVSFSATAAIPEPALASVLVGVAGVLARRRRVLS